MFLGECEKGYYCDGKTSFPCPSGTYNNFTSSKSVADCQMCPNGYFCTGPGEKDYTSNLCKKGYYCPEATKYETEFPCPAGTYNYLKGQSALSACQDCPSQYYCPQGSGIGTANPCPKGYYCPQRTGVGNMYACPLGTYSDETRLNNSTQCKQCPVGHYCPDGSKNEPTINPVACPPGTYNPDTGSGYALNCKLCDPGFACPKTGMNRSDLYPCRAGHYCPNGTKVDNQFPCPPGTYTNASNLVSAEECSSCPATFSCGWGTTGSSGALKWQVCQQGHYCPEGTLNHTSFEGGFLDKVLHE